MKSQEGRPGTLHFLCNICGKQNLKHVMALKREEPSCGCGSTVRMRGMIHALSVALFGNSLTIPEFPIRKDIVGRGMSDWERYAQPLAEKLNYTNTYYHKSPRFDITRIEKEDEASIDFLLSTDVFEHIVPPVSVAFGNAKRLLKPGGAFVLSVPYALEGDTVEHFPYVHDYRIENREEGRVLVNQRADGSIEEYSSLVFHGGEGETLEFRVFSEGGLLSELEKAGFMDIDIMRDPYFEYGIFWPYQGSVPLIARSKARSIQIINWGPRSNKVGSSVNVQPDGSSAIWLKVDRSVDEAHVSLWIGDMLISPVVVSEDLITAKIPFPIIKQLGSYPVSLQCNAEEPISPGNLCIYA